MKLQIEIIEWDHTKDPYPLKNGYYPIGRFASSCVDFMGVSHTSDLAPDISMHEDMEAQINEYRKKLFDAIQKGKNWLKKCENPRFRPEQLTRHERLLLSLESCISTLKIEGELAFIVCAGDWHGETLKKCIEYMYKQNYEREI